MFRGNLTSAVATIQIDRTTGKKKDKGVPVVIWDISESDEKALDSYEGYPTFYQKELISVTYKDGTKQKVMAYIMNSRYKVGVPSGHYFNVILEGYIDNGLDSEYLFKQLQSVTKMIK